MKKLSSNITLEIMVVVLTTMIFLLSVFFLMFGIAKGLESLFVDRAWISWLITGGSFILATLLFLKLYVSSPKQSQTKSFLPDEKLIQEIIDTLDIKSWAKKYPYQTTGAAALAGFIIAGKDVSEFSDTLKKILLPLLLEYLKVKLAENEPQTSSKGDTL